MSTARRRSATLAVSCLLAGCSDRVMTPLVPPPLQAPTAQAPACSAWPGAEIVQIGYPGPAVSQETACRSNEPPRFERFDARRRAAGVEVTYDLLDSDSGGVCDVTYMNGRWQGAACGGPGGPLTAFSSGLTFPVEVRLVAWDDKGCLALPVCLTVR
ncbi:MAG: hypothetical protein ABW221_16665 [Vicinamibacteria bacterium]